MEIGKEATAAASRNVLTVDGLECQERGKK